jgi:phenylacetate-CoA ligase
MVIYAYETTSYYRRLFSDARFNPYNLEKFDEIGVLPTIDKETIENHRAEMVSKDYDLNHLVVSHTGGTSSAPTRFYIDRNCNGMRIGRQLAILEQCGYNLGDRCGLIWGAHVDLVSQKHKGSLRLRARKFASAKEVLCCNVLTEKDLDDYYYVLRDFRPKVLYGYPNAIGQFADHIQERNFDPLCMEKVICTAEQLNKNNREKIRKAFHAEVFDLYCTREHGCVAFECREHKGYHIDTGSVHLEIPHTDRDGYGPIVITDLLNHGMPLIRNRIGDIGKISDTPCGCGIPLPLLENIQGRIADNIYLEDGSKLTGVMLIDEVTDLPGIRQIQFIQKTVDVLDVQIVVDRNYQERTREIVIGNLKKLTKGLIRINVQVVGSIGNSRNSGKYPEVVSFLSPGRRDIPDAN